MHPKKPPFFQRRGLAILMGVAFLLPIIGLGSMKAIQSNRNDVKSWLPAEYDETKTFKWYWERFEGEAFIMASWDGCTLGSEKLANIANAIRKENAAEAKANRPRYFREISTGDEILNRVVNDQGVDRNAAIERLSGSVVGLDGKQTCLLMTISREEIDAWEKSGRGKTAKTAIFHAAVNKVYETADRFGIGKDDIHLGGPPVDNVAIDTEGEKSMITLAMVCAVLGLVMSWWTLRSWRFTIIVSTTAIFSAGLSLAIVWLSGRPMDAILMTMPALVFVAAASGAIHLSNYYRDSCKTGSALGAADRAIYHAWLPLALATGTTGIGLASLAISELVPIKWFGIFSALGVVGSFVILCTYTPALLDMWKPSLPKRRESSDDLVGSNGMMAAYAPKVGRWIIRHNGLVTAACLLVMAISYYGVNQVETSVKLMRLFSADARIRQDYAWLEQHLGPLVPVEIIIKVDTSKSKLRLADQLRLAREVQRAVEDMPEVGSALAAPTFAQTISENARGFRDNPINVMLNRNRHELREYWQRDDKTKEELWRVSARVGALDEKLDYGDFVLELKKKVDPILLAHGGQQVGLKAVYTGVVPLVYKAQHSLFNGLILGFIGDLVLIGIAIIALMRNFSAGPLLMLPSVFPLVFVFGAMGLMGIVVDTGTVMAPAVALGVTVDDAIHFMLWCRRGEKEGMSREEAIMFAYSDCAQPIYQSWAVIGLGLSAFAFSAFMPTQRFGLLMLTLLTVSSVGNLVFLPALLAGPAGHWFWLRQKKADKPLPPEPHMLNEDLPLTAPVSIKHRTGGDYVRVR